MGLLINGSMRKSWVTFYLRNGQMVARSAHSYQPKRRTRAQFVARQQLAHTCRLWYLIKGISRDLFPKTPTAYARFRTLMRTTPVVFTCKSDYSTFLLPGMPVSNGILPTVEQWLGEVDGTPALLTSLTADDIKPGDVLWLLKLHQNTRPTAPQITAYVSRLTIDSFRNVDGRLALVSDDFADNMSGWAVVTVHRKNGRKAELRCSSQTIVTNCTFYQAYTTEEALLKAAESYGGLTKEVRFRHYDTPEGL